MKKDLAFSSSTDKEDLHPLVEKVISLPDLPAIGKFLLSKSRRTHRITATISRHLTKCHRAYSHATGSKTRVLIINHVIILIKVQCIFARESCKRLCELTDAYNGKITCKNKLQSHQIRFLSATQKILHELQRQKEAIEGERVETSEVYIEANTYCRQIRKMNNEALKFRATSNGENTTPTSTDAPNPHRFAVQHHIAKATADSSSSNSTSSPASTNTQTEHKTKEHTRQKVKSTSSSQPCKRKPSTPKSSQEEESRRGQSSRQRYTADSRSQNMSHPARTGHDPPRLGQSEGGFFNYFMLATPHRTDLEPYRSVSPSLGDGGGSLSFDNTFDYDCDDSTTLNDPLGLSRNYEYDDESTISW